MKIHGIVFFGLLYTVSLTGCSNQSALENTVMEQAGQVDTLSYQINMLQREIAKNRNAPNKNAELETQIQIIKNEITTIFASSTLAYDEAIRANARIDNMAQSYTK